jgi:RecJ-like exonuclease
VTVGLPADSQLIADCDDRTVVRVRARVIAIQVEPLDAPPKLTARLADASGRIDAVFLGRRSIPGIEPGAVVDIEGRVCATDDLPRLFNPSYVLVSPA